MHWRASARVTFSLQCCEFLTPTFCLGCVSLRYALAMQMKFSNRKGHTVLRPFNLRSPIQIMYTSGGQDPAAYQDLIGHEPSVPCPQYEPNEAFVSSDIIRVGRIPSPVESACRLNMRVLKSTSYDSQPPLYTR